MYGIWQCTNGKRCERCAPFGRLRGITGENEGYRFVLKNKPYFRKQEKSEVKISPASVSAVIKKDKIIVKVASVVDGDTIKVLIGGKEEVVRLIGIDAPETSDPRKQVQCFGKEATDKAKEMLNGKTVVLESDSTQENKDKYGRLLRYVFADGINFNKLMVGEGYAHEYIYQNNPYKYMEEFKIAEKQAKEGKKGLWGDGVCN